MRNRPLLAIFAPLLSLLGACTAGTTVSTVPYYDSYVWPVVDYAYVPDTALWYDGYYYPYYGYAALAASSPGVEIDGGAVDGGSSGRPFPRPLGGILGAWRANVSTNCVPAVEWVDYDEDGVPASYDATFNCVNQTQGDRTSSVTGTISIADADDNDPHSGLSVTFMNFAVMTSSTGGNTRMRTLNGSASLMPIEGGAFQSTTDLTTTFDFSDAGTTRTEGTYKTTGQGTYTPEQRGGADVFTAGSVALSGASQLSRMVGNVLQTRTVTRQTNPPLRWNRDCRTQSPDSIGFDSGTLVYQDDQGSKVELQFNGCGNPTVTASH